LCDYVVAVEEWNCCTKLQVPLGSNVLDLTQNCLNRQE